MLIASETPDIAEIWRANLYSLVLPESRVDDETLAALRQRMSHEVRERLFLQGDREEFSQRFVVRIVDCASSIAVQINQTAAKYTSWVLKQGKQYDSTIWLSVAAFNRRDCHQEIAFTIHPGLLRTSDVDSNTISPAVIIGQPQVYLTDSATPCPKWAELLLKGVSTGTGALDPSPISAAIAPRSETVRRCSCDCFIDSEALKPEICVRKVLLFVLSTY